MGDPPAACSYYPYGGGKVFRRNHSANGELDRRVVKKIKLWHDPGATCWLEGVPETGRGVVIMTNGAMGDVLSLEATYPVIEEYLWPTGQWLAH